MMDDIDAEIDRALETTGLRRNRISILVEVDTDPIPGWGNDPEDYVKHIRDHLDRSIPHYNPVVKLASNDAGDSTPTISLTEIRKISEETYLRDIAPRITAGFLRLTP